MKLNLIVLFSLMFSLTSLKTSPQGIRYLNQLDIKKSSFPKILLIGDSISIGYQRFMINKLNNKAIVHFENRKTVDSKYVLENIEKWLGGESWDAIYVNFGLDDIKILDPVPNPSGDWGEEGGINTLTMEYEDRLREIASILNRQQTTVIWGTITPVPPNNPNLLLRHWGGGVPIPEEKQRWFPIHVQRYNKIASEIMREYGIYIHDLYSEVLPLRNKMQKTNSPYFTKEGYQFLGKQVADYIWNLIKPAQKIQFPENVVTILDTDIGPWLDIDDWFDVLIYSLSELDHGGIIMEHYASDWEEAALKRYLKWLGKEEIKYARGAQEPLKKSENGKILFPESEYGADLILNTMKESKKQIRVVCVGALTNVALAYLKNPELFMRKVESVWFIGGMLNGYDDAHSDGRWDTNIHRDQIAADIIFNNNIPLVWFPVSLELLVRSNGEQERIVNAIEHPAINWLYEGVDYWRVRRGKAWATRTQQEEGRRLWSIAAHAALNNKNEWMEFERGWAYFSEKDWSTFIRDPNGPDLLLVKLNKMKISMWYKEFIVSYFRIDKK